MASKRETLLEIARELRRTLDWQAAADRMGSLPASEEEREQFEAKLEAHRRAKRERKRAALMEDEAGSEAEGEAAEAGSDAPRSSETETDEEEETPWSDMDSFRSPEKRAMAAEDSSDETSGTERAERDASDDGGRDVQDDADSMTNAEKLEWLRGYLGECKRCPLWKDRTNVVFGEGDPEARLVFVGEAPGYYEDQEGRPFVGKAGTLLNKMIRAMGIEREDTYICNVLKSRPPDNRDPQPDEIAACIPFLEKQIGIIQPEIICTLGRPATQNLLDTNRGIGALRGTWQTYRGIDVMPTYHPAYLLRNDEMKPKTWNDLQLIIDRLDLPGPGGR